MKQNEIIDFFVNFLATPALLMGIFGMIGSIVQKKHSSEVFISTIKTMIGYLVLAGGASLLVSSLTGFDLTVRELFGVSPVIPNNDGIGGLVQGSLGVIGTLSSIVMIMSMIGNIIIARLTNLKYIYLSGHVLFYISICVVVTSVMVGLDPNSDGWIIITIGSLIVSMYMVISPAICQKFMISITSTNDVAMGHTSGLNYCISGYIGLAISILSKNKIKKCDDIKVSKKFAFIRNRSVLITATMTLIYAIVFFTGWGVLGKKWYVDNNIIENSNSMIIIVLIKSLTFAAGMEVILFGVRTILSELIPAFKGISEKVVPGAKPALDCPIVFPYSQNAVFIGFFGSIFGGLLMFGLSILISGTTTITSIIIPGTISIFFTGATAGVFGDTKGGRLGAIIAGFVDGFLVTLIPYLFILANLLPKEILAISATWGDSDFCIGLFIGFWKYINLGFDIKWAIFATSIFAWVLLITFGSIIQFKKNKKSKIEVEKNKQINKIDKKEVKDEKVENGK
ncbi:PTS ascorbate transporter subunit IIC [Spiroplasma endosymbiont of Aspidapion aeneum]|uniref:PTS ascorbate transporter subunit IIC n=1 Tax=Spiroplasma endosymbiont of Aspidapion aeneum TaxID=3066276 RepID=UPI00313B5663